LPAASAGARGHRLAGRGAVATFASMRVTEESRRLDAATEGVPWKKWGPYLSERQWGTVREDYSSDGQAWDYFSHDQARSRAYHWGEDGLGGICDDKQRLCFGVALWNGRDAILKERPFGLTNSEGNHGEDVKEYYFYLDSTPTHSYLKFLYKYPQEAFPYRLLADTSRSRSRNEWEYELLDTGVFDHDDYFDVVIEYAKAAPEDILIRITAFNRGPAAATLHLLPTFWFRNTWSWEAGDGKARPQLRAEEPERSSLTVHHDQLGEYVVRFEGNVPLLFTENDTNQTRLFGQPNPQPYVKDAFHEYVINKRADAVNPNRTGTKAAGHYQRLIGAGESAVVRVRLTRGAAQSVPELSATAFDAIVADRLGEADAYYDAITPPTLSEDERRVMRQALSGMLWSKQYYYFDLDKWLTEHDRPPRNRAWRHMVNDDIISMPDKWEYPWYAAWDLAFHTIALTMVDGAFARDQIELMLSERYLHPNGQLPAYEWNFGDVNPPVHAYATLFSYYTSADRSGEGDKRFLARAFQKLLLNFTWWVNRKDPSGNNVFEGGFLGLDNIGVFDRSAQLPGGGRLEQADGTAWMAFFCQNMLQIALELGRDDPSYEPMVVKFVEHFLWIASSMDCVGNTCDEMWDEEDGFFYDVLRLPDGSGMRMKVRSMVGLLPLAATTVISQADARRFPTAMERIRDFVAKRPNLTVNIAPIDRPGVNGDFLLAVVTESKLRRILTRMLDEGRFFSPFGIRSMSRWHLDHPYEMDMGGQHFQVQYLPGESNTGMFGGNSNWRGPIWLPVNLLIIRALLQFYVYYGNEFKIECPTGSGRLMTLFEVAREISRRLEAIFLRDSSGQRPLYGGVAKFQRDPHWRDLITFNEYFHGDNGAGLGAAHQTGWTGTVAKLIQLFGYLTPEALLHGGSTRPVMSDYSA
jgi:Mannosylglycerate hydrolase MGH1-like glycoside hydrolase domain